MALLSRASRASFFNLPPHLRAAAYQQTPATISRSFSVTPIRKHTAAASTISATAEITQGVSTTLVDIVTAIPTGVLDLIHSAGLPWWATIPATAILVRGVLGYYWISKPARRRQLIQRNLGPVVSLRAMSLARSPEMRRRIGSYGKLRALYALWCRFYYSIESMQLYGKQFGAPVWSLAPFANFGLLIAFSEAVRMKCGSRAGLLSVFLSPFQSQPESAVDTISGGEQTVQQDGREELKFQPAHEKLGVDATSGAKETVQQLGGGEFGSGLQRQTADSVLSASTTSATSTPLQDLPTDQLEVLAAAREATTDPSILAALSKIEGSISAHQLEGNANSVTNVAYQIKNYAAHLDPSLETETFLWIADLTVPDPTFLLPLIVSLLMAARVIFKPKVADSMTSTETQQSAAIPSNSIKKPSLSPELQAQIQALNPPSNRTTPNASNLQIFENLTLQQRWSIWVSIAFGFVMLKMPAAILLYFASSGIVGFVQARWLEYWYPLPPVISPCKRRMRFANVKEMDD